MERFPRVIALTAGVSMVAFGVWAFADPQSFFERLAGFPPYNRHFIHDIGAFQIGIGAALIAVLKFSDGLFVVLGGAAVASLFHFVAHLEDTDIGGRAIDPALVGVLALALTVAAVTRALVLQREQVQSKGE